MTTLDAATKKSLQNALYTYVQNYGGETIADLRAISGALLAVGQKSGNLTPQGLEIEEWVDVLVENFDLQQLAERLLDEGEKAIAAQANYWRETLEVKVRATLDAYIQKYSPSLDTVKIQDIVTTTLPIIEDAQISRDEAFRLIDKISQQFDLPAAVERALDPKWVKFADKVVQVFRHREIEDSTTAVMNAYVQKFQPAAIELGEDLIEQAVQAVTNSKLKLGLEVDLDSETQKLIVKQVMLKFNLMEAPPTPSKTALEVAQEVHDEVQRYRKAQGLNAVNYLPRTQTKDEVSGGSSLGGPMGIGYDLKPPSHPSEEE